MKYENENMIFSQQKFMFLKKQKLNYSKDPKKTKKLLIEFPKQENSAIIRG